MTADELRRRGHSVGLAHGRGTGHGETAWHEVFSDRFAIDEAQGGAAIALALAMEVSVAYFIRDNLTLNIINLLYPLDFIHRWQAGAP